jgi:hypothetical protein
MHQNGFALCFMLLFGALRLAADVSAALPVAGCVGLTDVRQRSAGWAASQTGLAGGGGTGQIHQPGKHGTILQWRMDRDAG